MSRLLEAPPRPRLSRHRPRHRRPPRIGLRVVGMVALLALIAASAIVWRTGVADFLFARTKPEAATHSLRPSAPPSPTIAQAVTPSPTQSAAPSTSGPINTAFPGITTFRGNASRSYYGQGPLPKHPTILWRYPVTGRLCSESSDQGGKRLWCGTGWTGQPNVIVGKGGKIEIRIGAYDGHYHFLNGTTGQPTRPDLVTGDLAKGSATSDPDGYPLYYAGSRDNLFRVVALDRPSPTVLWSIDADTSVPNRLWNNDWDGAALVIGDYLLEGGENSWFYVVRLHRHYDKAGLVQVKPEIVALIPGFDSRLLADLHDRDVSIEGSVAFRDGVVYFGNSGGLVQGWDISNVLAGGTHYRRVFRFWEGDETDASVVIDDQGFLYVGRHASVNVQTRSKVRDHEVGSLMKLDPRKPKNPVVWSVQIGGFQPDGGILSTPAIHKGIVYVMDTAGALVAVDQRSGKALWTVKLPGPTWMSPVPIGNQILVGDCAGVLHDFDISKPKRPPDELWRVQLSGCIESTPAVWKGMIWIGSRGGTIYGIGSSA